MCLCIKLVCVHPDVRLSASLSVYVCVCVCVCVCECELAFLQEFRLYSS